MAPDPSRIWDVCQDVLQAVVTRHGAPLPSRQYVAAGLPAWDCELVAVWCESTAGFDANVAVEAVEAIRRAAAHSMRYGIFVVTVTRCAPALDHRGRPPSVADEETVARLLYEDAQRILNSLLAAEKAGELGDCNGVAFQQWNTIGPEGGYVAGELRVRIGLAGI